MEKYIVKELFYYCNIRTPECGDYELKLLNYHALSFALEGSSSYIVDGTECPINKNNAVFLTPGVIRERIYNKKPFWFVNFNFEVIDGVDVPIPTSVPLSSNFPSDLKKLIQTFPYAHVPQRNLSKQKLTNLLNFILLELIEQNSSKSKNVYVNEILKIVDENITKKLTLQDISNELNLSKEYISSIFKKETNRTLTNYINEQKMTAAKEFVVNSDIPLVEISQILGYENYNYFSRLFKKQFENTPINMRKGDF